MENIKDIFGSMVFNDRVMCERLPKDTYRTLRKTVSEGKDLDIGVANEVAHAMKEWAIGLGATHYTHWFQPLTGVTAEKHEGFLNLQKDGNVLLTFSGKNLIKGEPDASSFPSGGLRNTFEARGYTAWDPTSYAFIKDHTLYIPTVFCSYGGQVLDKKTPLLRSCEAISMQAVRVLRALGDTATERVTSKTGAEQEYFLIDRSMFRARPDLYLCGRTLFGSLATKASGDSGHYFGAIAPRVKEFMEDLDGELWKLGVYAVTEHNEAAPAQYELAPNYSDTNTAVDQNQLMMETMKNVAEKHGMVCLLHEKPFEGVNGSGKHNNWSLCTQDGTNLFDLGADPLKNTRFLLFLSAVIKAVDDYQDLLRISVASAGNDCRLGGNEAPPAILSIYLGDGLTEVLEYAQTGKKRPAVADMSMTTGVHVLPELRRDNSDRNRTSPFSFTGNKFEFRMAGSSQSVSDCNMIINTAVAHVLSEFADKLEASKKPDKAAMRIVRDTFTNHKRIIFNGNNYSDEWKDEAARRGLACYPTASDAIVHLLDKKNVRLFESVGIFTSAELASRREILLSMYSSSVETEARTMLYMSSRAILPALYEYSGELAAACVNKTAAGVGCESDTRFCRKISSLSEAICEKAGIIESLLSENTGSAGDQLERANFCRDSIIPAMRELREVCDSAERCLPSSKKPYPDYEELLF